MNRDPVRAPKAYREHLNKVAMDVFQKHRVGMSPTLVVDEEIGGKKFSFIIFVVMGDPEKIAVKSSDPYEQRWYSSWIRGKGTKIWGDYEMFEKDILLFKLSGYSSAW